MEKVREKHYLPAPVFGFDDTDISENEEEEEDDDEDDDFQIEPTPITMINNSVLAFNFKECDTV